MQRSLTLTGAWPIHAVLHEAVIGMIDERRGERRLCEVLPLLRERLMQRRWR